MSQIGAPLNNNNPILQEIETPLSHKNDNHILQEIKTPLGHNDNLDELGINQQQPVPAELQNARVSTSIIKRVVSGIANFFTGIVNWFRGAHVAPPRPSLTQNLQGEPLPKASPTEDQFNTRLANSLRKNTNLPRPDLVDSMCEAMNILRDTYGPEAVPGMILPREFLDNKRIKELADNIQKSKNEVTNEDFKNMFLEMGRKKAIENIATSTIKQLCKNQQWGDSFDPRPLLIDSTLDLIKDIHPNEYAALMQSKNSDEIDKNLKPLLDDLGIILRGMHEADTQYIICKNKYLETLAQISGRTKEEVEKTIPISFLRDPHVGKGIARKDEARKGKKPLKEIYNIDTIRKSITDKYDKLTDIAIKNFQALDNGNPEMLRICGGMMLEESGTFLNNYVVKDIVDLANKVNCKDLLKNIDLNHPESITVNTIKNLITDIATQINSNRKYYDNNKLSAGDKIYYDMLALQIIITREPKIAQCILKANPEVLAQAKEEISAAYDPDSVDQDSLDLDSSRINGTASTLLGVIYTLIEDSAKEWLNPDEAKAISNEAKAIGTASKELKNKLATLLTEGPKNINDYSGLNKLAMPVFKKLVGQIDFTNTKVASDKTIQIAEALSTIENDKAFPILQDLLTKYGPFKDPVAVAKQFAHIANVLPADAKPEIYQVLQTYINKLDQLQSLDGLMDKITIMFNILSSTNSDALPVLNSYINTFGLDSKNDIDTIEKFIASIANLDSGHLALINSFIQILDNNQRDAALNTLNTFIAKLPNWPNINEDDPKAKDPNSDISKFNKYLQEQAQIEVDTELEKGRFDNNGIFEQVNGDAPRETYRINGKYCSNSKDRTCNAIIEAIPGENSRKFVTSLLHQGAMAPLSNMNDDIQEGKTPIPNYIDEDFKSTPLVYRSQTKILPYDLTISSDGNTATIKLNLLLNFKPGLIPGVKDDKLFGECLQTQTISIDLKDDKPKIISCTYGQKISAMNTN